MPLTLYPTAGFGPKFDSNEIDFLSKPEITLLRNLAKKVAEIAAEPIQEKKRKLWYSHNQLEKTRPLVLVFPEDSWAEILGEDQLEVKPIFWKQWEWYLRHLIYRSSNFIDDFVVEPNLYISKIINIGSWGVDVKYIKTENEQGSWVYDPPLKNPDNIKKMKTPTIEVDEKTTVKIFNAVNEVFGDILDVHLYCPVPIANLLTEATMFRGIEQVMMDVYDRPQWLHELMSILTNGVLEQAKFLEDGAHLTLNNRNHYTDTGGIGYTNELPAADYDNNKVRLKDLWGLGLAQELSGVGPAQHEEFAIDYQVKILEKYGLNCYGCCEPLTKKFDLVKNKIPRLRRVSVSPWCDFEIAASALEDKYIYSWKYNPSNVIAVFEPEQIRADIQNILHVAKDCVLEIILKDTITIKNEPQRLNIWSKIVKEEIDKIW